MSMSLDELIAINGLLIERETAYAGVSSLEDEVSKILGQAFPFQKPLAELPSTKKAKAKRGAKRAKKKGPPKIRKLRAGEIAYRVHTLQNGDRLIEDLPDFRPFEHLLLSPLPNLQIQKVEILDESRKPSALLYER